MIRLRGMTWDHPRGVEPLRAAAAEFTTRHPDVDIEWVARPLRQFEETPIAKLAVDYDLIAIDHPLLGDACTPSDSLRDLRELLSAEFLTSLETGSVGPSYRSYRLHGGQYALPVDVAAQVSAYRPDLVGSGLPRSWEDIAGFARELPSGRSIAIAGSPTHLFSTWLSLCQHNSPTPDLQDDGRPQWWTDDGIDTDIGRIALNQLYKLLECCSPRSLAMDPIALLDRMGTEDELVYSPLVFGYSNYARPVKGSRTVRFLDPPGPAGRPTGTVLGGVGLAVSAESGNPRTAAQFLEYTTSPSYQRVEYVTNGGQPGHADAWKDPNANRITNDFFYGTRATLERSFLRPRHPGYPAYQVRAGRRLHELTLQRERTDGVMKAMQEIWRGTGPNTGREVR